MFLESFGVFRSAIGRIRPAIHKLCVLGRRAPLRNGTAGRGFHLNSEERHALLQVMRTRKIEAPEVRRTGAILMFDEGESDRRDSESVRLDRDMVRCRQGGFRETTLRRGGRDAGAPLHRLAATNLIGTPVIGRFEADLSDCLELGVKPGKRLAAAAPVHSPGTAMSCDKARNADVDGDCEDLEHRHAPPRPKRGKTMRSPDRGVLALIPPAANVAAAGTSMDAQLGNMSDARSFDHFDCTTIAVPDGPWTDEIILAVAFVDGAHPNARVGKGRIAK